METELQDTTGVVVPPQTYVYIVIEYIKSEP